MYICTHTYTLAIQTNTRVCTLSFPSRALSLSHTKRHRNVIHARNISLSKHSNISNIYSHTHTHTHTHTHRNVNRARNIWDRAVAILPRVDQFWYKYAYMEEMLGNVAGARQIFDRWMQWEPEVQQKNQNCARQILHRWMDAVVARSRTQTI